MAAFILKDDRFYNYVSASSSTKSNRSKSGSKSSNSKITRSGRRCPKGTRKNRLGICEKITS